MALKWIRPYVYVKHVTEDERKAKYHGSESRQVMRRKLREEFVDGNAQYRKLMGLPEPRIA